MNRFKINDPVRIIATRCRWFDLVGTIHDSAADQFHVRGLDAAPVWFYPHELEHAEWAGVEG